MRGSGRQGAGFGLRSGEVRRVAGEVVKHTVCHDDDVFGEVQRGGDDEEGEEEEEYGVYSTTSLSTVPV